MNRCGLLGEGQNKLDYVLALTVENSLQRCLQTTVFKNGMAKSIHHARVLIRQCHIRLVIHTSSLTYNTPTVLCLLVLLQNITGESCSSAYAILCT